MTLTSHPTDARYFSSRAAARENCQRGERVIRLGHFQSGSFGCYGPLTSSGQPIGGPNAGIIVWMVAKK